MYLLGTEVKWNFIFLVSYQVKSILLKEMVLIYGNGLKLFMNTQGVYEAGDD